LFFIKIKIENIGYIFNKNDKRKKKNLIKILELKRIIQLNKKIIISILSLSIRSKFIFEKIKNKIITKNNLFLNFVKRFKIEKK
jgi:hypothetical protein